LVSWSSKHAIESTRWWLWLHRLLCLCQHVTRTRPKSAFWGRWPRRDLDPWPVKLLQYFFSYLDIYDLRRWFLISCATNCRYLSNVFCVQNIKYGYLGNLQNYYCDSLCI